MTFWTRRRTNINGTVTEDDWQVLRDGEPVGRVYADLSPQGAPRWRWATQTIPGRSGYSATMAEALDMVRSVATSEFLRIVP